MSSRATLLATVVRGLRARALLSAGSVLLIALAVGSAVLGPVFQSAVTTSYLVTRLDEAPNRLTGLSWTFEPRQQGGAGDPEPALARGMAAQLAAAYDGPFASPQTSLLSDQVETAAGLWRLAAKPDACEHLEVTGRCPGRPGEVLLLAGDAEFTGTAVGDALTLGALGDLRVVGTYRVPDAGEEDFWFDLGRFASIPPAERSSGSTPYQPAPLVTVERAFVDLPVGWSVLVDRRLEVPPDLGLADTEEAERVAATLAGPPRAVGGGRLAGDSINDLATILTETRGQQDTARASITPAVVSLVLVALALLLRLLTAAADLRSPELALASLRGLGRRQMWALGLSEPLVLLVVALPVGGVLGIALALGLVRWWLVPGLPLPLPWEAWLTGGLVGLAALVVAVLAVALVLRVSLSDQLTGVRRPRHSSRLASLAQLVLVAAALAVLVSKLSAGAPGDPDMTDLVLPVLLAVVAGLGATRATTWLAGRWTRRPSRSLAGFVAARAISRRTEGTLVVLPVTAAIAICVFGAGVHDSAGQWRTSVAATRAPADVVWRSSLPLDQTVALTHRLDPEGRWLMAAGTVVTQGPSYSVVDTSRLARVARWQDQWTPGTSAAEVADLLGPEGEPPRLEGRSLALTVTVEGEVADEVHVRLRLDGTGGDRPRYAFVGPFGPGTSTARTAVPSCRDGCELDALTVGGPAGLPVRIRGEVVLSDLAIDGEPVPGAFEGAGWVRSPTASAAAAVGIVEAGSAQGAERLRVVVDSGEAAVIAQLVAGGLPAAIPVVRGADAATEARGGASSTTSALTFDVDPVVTAASVPLLGPLGLMVDHEVLTLDREVYEQQDAPVLVLARSDTPQGVRLGLRDRGAVVETTLADVRRTLDQGAYALALRLYAVVAALVLLMALAGLVVSTAVQLPARRRDAAALRVVGVPRRAVVSAVVRELAVVLGGTALAGLAAGTLAQHVVLRTVTLGYVEDLTTPALVAAVDWGRLALLALLAAVLLGSVALVSAALTVRGARGSTLREDAR